MRGVYYLSQIELPSNCLFWVIGKKITQGGEITWVWSKQIKWLPHFLWRPSNVYPWSWYSPDPGLAWYNLIYYGKVYKGVYK